MSSVIHNADESRFEMEVDGLLSVADYRRSGDVLAITHVEVPTSQRGQGLAHILAAGVVNHARDLGVKIRPICPFMVVYMKRHRDTADVLAQ